MSNRLLQLLPALLLAVLALVLALVGLSRSGADDTVQPVNKTTAAMVANNAATQAEYSYWVSTGNLNVGDKLTTDGLAKITSSTQLNSAIPTSKDIANKVLRRPLHAGEIVTKSHLNATSLLATAITPGYRAIAISVSQVIAAGGLLQPGDLVDVLVSFRNGPNKDKQPLVLTLLKNVEVLALHGLLQGQTPDKDKRGSNGTALLLVPEADAAKLFLADQTGAFRLAAVGSGDAANGMQVANANTTGDKTTNAAAVSGNGEKVAAAGPTADNKANTDKKGAAEEVAVTKEDVVKWKDLFPEQKEKAKPVRHVRRAPSGNKVQVFEGSKARSTYVH